MSAVVPLVVLGLLIDNNNQNDKKSNEKIEEIEDNKPKTWRDFYHEPIKKIKKSYKKLKPWEKTKRVIKICLGIVIYPVVFISFTLLMVPFMICFVPLVFCMNILTNLDINIVKTWKDIFQAEK